MGKKISSFRMVWESKFALGDSGSGGDPAFELNICDADGNQLYPYVLPSCPEDVQAAAARLHALSGPGVYEEFCRDRERMFRSDGVSITDIPQERRDDFALVQAWVEEQVPPA